MKIKLFEKKYRKSEHFDGTQEIKIFNFDQSFLDNEAFKVKTTYVKDESGKTIGEEKTKTLDVKAIKKRFPNCVKIKMRDLYINL